MGAALIGVGLRMGAVKIDVDGGAQLGLIHMRVLRG
jgi:hypothetical protein